jgi:uncharacterized protein YkwD
LRIVRRALFIFILFNLTGCVAVGAAFSPSTPTPTVEYAIHIVRSGDTLAQIAALYQITIEQLIALNADIYPVLARDPSLLQVGWRLRVPVRGALLTTQSQINLDAARQTAEGVNAARAQRGLALLRSDSVLTRIAGNRSDDMIARGYFSHDDPQTGQEPLLRYLQATGYSYRYAGENIAEIKNGPGWVLPWLTVAARYSTADLANEFVKDWLNSTEHRANIFNARYRRTGVALAVSPDGRRIVATQVFSD